MIQEDLRSLRYDIHSELDNDCNIEKIDELQERIRHIIKVNEFYSFPDVLEYAILTSNTFTGFDEFKTALLDLFPTKKGLG